MQKLVIAEKNSVAKSISAVLGANKRENGYFIGNGYIVSYCAGHLLELAAPDFYNEKYAKWRYADLPIIPEKWKYIALKNKTAQLKVLKDLMNCLDVECVINACDAGREGENIFRIVYEYAECTKKIYRLWISSLTDEAIKMGFENLKDGTEYDNLYAAASCRERADWIVGLNATRAFSCLYGGSTLNVGRVQSPTLAMIVKREADIAAFIKEPFYIPTIDCGGFAAFGENLKDRETAEIIRESCDGKTAVVRSVERQKKTFAPPKLHDLTSLQREANRIFGFTAAQTLEYAQSLYEKTVLTYPRVDSRYITTDMRGPVSELITQIQKGSPFGRGLEFAPNIDRVINNDKVSDHHAILPTAEISKSDFSAFSSGERDILDLVVVRLLCAVASVHSYESITSVLDCGGYSFMAKGKIVIENGWRAIESTFRDYLKTKPETEDGEDDVVIPELLKGQTFDNVAASVKESMTTPPHPYTEDTLLSAMETAGVEDISDEVERQGLGTPATRAAIIEKLVKTDFIERQKKNLIPSDKGIYLTAVLPETLTSPKLTAEWENRLLEVQKGKLQENEFMDGIRTFITDIVKENNIPKPEFVGLLGSNKVASEPIGICPRCKSAVRESGKGFFCDKNGCGFKLWKESKFWTAKKKPLTADIVADLLKNGRTSLKGLYSEKTGKKYDATVILDDTEGIYVNFKLIFDRRV